MEEIKLYNCNRKLEFLKRGYCKYLFKKLYFIVLIFLLIFCISFAALYKEQEISMRRNIIINNHMRQFMLHVVQFERETGGDPNIFDQLVENEANILMFATLNISEHFSNSRIKFKKLFLSNSKI